MLTVLLIGDPSECSLRFTEFLGSAAMEVAGRSLVIKAQLGQRRSYFVVVLVHGPGPGRCHAAAHDATTPLEHELDPGVCFSGFNLVGTVSSKPAPQIGSNSIGNIRPRHASRC
jgi:hypothetical protein